MELNFDTISKAINQNLWATLVAFTLILVWIKKDDLAMAIKNYLDTKNVALDKRTDELAKINERYFHLYENSSKALEKISEAIMNFKEGLLVVEARLGNKIDQEMENIRREIRDNKIEQLTLVIKEREKSNPFIKE